MVKTWPLIWSLAIVGIVLNIIMVFLYGCTYRRVTRAKVNYMRRICILMIGYSIASIIVLCSYVALSVCPQWYSEAFLLNPH